MCNVGHLIPANSAPLSATMGKKDVLALLHFKHTIR